MPPTPKPKKISDLISKIGSVAFTSHFICEFDLPRNARSFFNDRANAGFVGSERNKKNKKLIQLSCSEASLPGSSLATTEINNDYYGVTEKHAYRRLYDNQADFTFYVDREYKIIDFFENWISYISGEDNLQEQNTSNYSYRVNFPNSYKASSLSITKFERDYSGNGITYQFINAFPTSINSMPVSYESSQLLKLTVSFTYSRYTIARGYTPDFTPLPGLESFANPLTNVSANNIDFDGLFGSGFNNFIPFQ